MKKNLKVALIVSFSLILLGCAVFSFAMMKLNWNFDKISIGKYETNEYVINDGFKGINVWTDTSDIEFVISEDDTAKIVCFEHEKVKHTVEVKGGIIWVEYNDTRKWYEYIGLSLIQPKITIYLPKGEYWGLTILADTSDCTVPADLTFRSINIKTNTGDVANYASASGVKIETDTGDITSENHSAKEMILITSTGKITVNDVKCEGDIRANVSTGDIIASNVECEDFLSSGYTGSIKMDSVIAKERYSIKRSTGDVKFTACDANDISIETDTGNVIGSLKTLKTFVTQTDTGKVRVPDSYSNGGRCEVITDTGDIDIQIYW